MFRNSISDTSVMNNENVFRYNRGGLGNQIMSYALWLYLKKIGMSNDSLS